jgi:hypothetical protein
VTFTAWSLHLVVRHWTGSHLAGAVGGWTFLASRWTLWEFVPSTPQYALLLYLPVIVLLAADPASRPRTMLLLLALVVLQSLASLLYAATAVFVPLGVVALGRLARRPTRAAGFWLLGELALAALVLLIPAWGHVALRLQDPDLGERTWWRWWHQTTDLPWGLVGYGVPTALPLPLLLLVGVGTAGRLSWARGGFGAPPRAARAHAVLWAAVGTLISISPDTTWRGQAIWSPLRALAAWVPVYRFLPITPRLGIGGLIGLALLAGLAFAECARPLRGRRAGRVTVAALAALVFGTSWLEYRATGSHPLCMSPCRPRIPSRARSPATRRSYGC